MSTERGQYEDLCELHYLLGWFERAYRDTAYFPRGQQLSDVRRAVRATIEEFEFVMERDK